MYWYVCICILRHTHMTLKFDGMMHLCADVFVDVINEFKVPTNVAG